MKLEVLVSTINQENLDLVEKMHLRTDAIIINQSDKIDYTFLETTEKTIRMYTYNERGIGKSRNNALMKAQGDICLLADDDIYYEDNYENIVLEAFNKQPKADVIIFNVKTINSPRVVSNIHTNKRINYFNFMRYGAVRIAFRRNKIIKSNIFFSLMFGGGATYGSGEDTLFIYDCLRKGLKIYTNTAQIATVDQSTSTWFTGINRKLYTDKGAQLVALNKRYARILTIILALKWYNHYKGILSIKEVIKFMNQGINEYLAI